jgi:hypothetical protein
MTAAVLTLVMCPMVSYEPLREDGEISGVVLNATQDGAPAGDVDIVLRATADGRFAPVAQTKADAQGRFRFEKLPVGGDFLYVPGANRGGIHYPGPRVRLTAYQSQARVELQIHETQSHPNPLVAKQHVIRIQPEPGALRVTESILVDNPTTKTYVGRETSSEAEPVTLSLAVPPNFDRTTFHKEFFGRRFSFSGQKLVTGIPWTPGEKELTFTYVVPNEMRHVQWQRPLDLPCSDVQVYVTGERPEEVRCNLGKAGEGQTVGELMFASRGPLEPGHVIRVEFGSAPVPWFAYARWAAAALLVGLVAVTGLVTLRRRNRETQPAAPPPAKRTSSQPGRSRKPGRSRAGRRRHRQSVSR